MKKINKKRGWLFVGFGCGCLLFLIFMIAGIYLYAGWQGYNEAPMIVEVQDLAPSFAGPYTLSSDQEDKILAHGYPEAFTILFYEEETISGSTQTVRLETWDYYTQGLGLTFINGKVSAEDPIEIELIGTLDPLPYSPEQFSAFMSLDEVLTATGIDTYVEIPLDKDLLDRGVSYFANSLTFGLKNNELRYVEALAIGSE